MGKLLKIEYYKRKRGCQWTTYIPISLAKAMGLVKGEKFDFKIIDGDSVLLTRVGKKQNSNGAKLETHLRNQAAILSHLQRAAPNPMDNTHP